MIIKIKMNDFNRLYKRLLLQPLSFKVNKNDIGADIELNNTSKLGDLKSHIASTVMDIVFEDIMSRELKEIGVSKLWIEHKVLNKIDRNYLHDSWGLSIIEKTNQNINAAIVNDEIINLNGYEGRASEEDIKSVQQYAQVIETMMFNEIIIDTVKDFIHYGERIIEPLNIREIVIEGEPLDVRYSGKRDSGESILLLTSEDIYSNQLDIHKEIVYQENSDRYNEIQFYAYTLIMMYRWKVDSWLVHEDMLSIISLLSNKLDIPVTINLVR